MTDRPSTWYARLNQRWLVGLCIYLSYILTAYLGLLVPSVRDAITLFWPPIGLAVAVLARVGWWTAIPLFLAALSTNLVRCSLPTSLAIALGNTISAGLAVLILRLFRFNGKTLSIQDVFVLVGAAFLGAAVSASNGTIWLAVANVLHTVADIENSVFFWWLGDSAGILIFGGLGLTVQRSDFAELKTRSKFLGLNIALLLAICGVLFSFPFPDRADFKIFALAGLVVYLTYIAMHTTTAWSIALSILLGVFGIAGTAFRNGPLLDTESAQVTLTSLWCWLVVNMLVVSILGGLHNLLRRANEQISQDKRHYQALVEGNPALILRFSADGTILFANDTAERVIVGEGRSLVGDSITRYIYPEDWPIVFELLRQDGPPIAHELLLNAANGTRHIIRWKARELRDEYNVIREFIAVGFDVTDLRRAEAERSTYLERLFHAKKLESLGVMAGGIAHDFNNLLTAMMGYCDLAKEEAQEQPQLLSHLSRIDNSAQRAAELVQQMMAYAGQTRVKIAPFDLNELIQTTIEVVQVNIPKTVQVRFSPDRKLPQLEADAVQIRQVVMNLIINAGEAIGDKEGTIEVQTDQLKLLGAEPLDSSTSEDKIQLEAGEYVRVQIRDNGPGMTPAIRSRIFEPFFSTKFQGRGLGLASVLGIIQAHSGSIGASSRVGVGTLFTFILPVRYRKPADAAGMPSLVQHSTEQPELPPPATALIYLPDDDTRQELALLLEVLQWKTLLFSSETALLKQLEHYGSKTNLVVLNWPRESSTAEHTLATIQKQFPGLKSLLISELSLTAIPTRFARQDVLFLVKPVTMSELEKSLRKLFASE